MTQKLEALHLEALCEEVRNEGGIECKLEIQTVFQTISHPTSVPVCLSVCRICSRESRGTQRWRQLIWF